MSANTDYIQSYIGSLATLFGYDLLTYMFINSEALEAYGVSDEADATDAVKMHALLRYKAVERMLIDAAGDVDYKADGESFSQSQVSEHLNKMQGKALASVLPYLPEGQIQQSQIEYPDDPYSISGQVEHDAQP